MEAVTAADASRRFTDLLGAVEHRGERYAIVRRGRVVAQLVPAPAPTGADVKAMLRSHRPDPVWAGEVRRPPWEGNRTQRNS